MQMLSSLDLFKSPIVIYFNGKSQRSSSLGICFSLLIFTYLLFQFSTSDFFLKESPTVVVQSLKQIHAKRIDFDLSKPLIIAMGDITDQNLKIYDPTIFSVSVLFVVDGQMNI